MHPVQPLVMALHTHGRMILVFVLVLHASVLYDGSKSVNMAHDRKQLTIQLADI